MTEFLELAKIIGAPGTVAVVAWYFFRLVVSDILEAHEKTQEKFLAQNAQVHERHAEAIDRLTAKLP